MSHPGMRTKVPIMIASIMLSFLLWMAIQLLRPRSAVLVQVPLKVFGAEGYAVSSISPEMVTVRVDGTAEQVRMIDDSTTTAYVDIGESALPGRHTYRIRLDTPRRFLGEARLLQTTAMVNLEPQTTRILPVVVEPLGTIPVDRNLEYAGATVDPRTVTIAGKESVVMEASEARVFISLADLEPGASVLQIVEVVDESGNPLDVLKRPEAVRIRPELRPVNELAPTSPGP